MSTKTDHDTYVKEHVDVRVWLEGYFVQSIALFEPLIRDAIALEASGEMSTMLQGVKR